jgi:hypothetical protein
MDSRQAAKSLEVIRTLMERTTQYQLLTARAGLTAGALAGLGALSFLWLDPANPASFGVVWALVFLGSLEATIGEVVVRGRRNGEPLWSRQARTVVGALAPALVSALFITVWLAGRGEHLWLPGVWLLCYGQGALATSSYAPAPIRWMGGSAIVLGGIGLWLGPAWAIPMMGVGFGLGHLSLGVVLLVAEKRQRHLRLHRCVA